MPLHLLYHTTNTSRDISIGSPQEDLQQIQDGPQGRGEPLSDYYCNKYRETGAKHQRHMPRRHEPLDTNPSWSGSIRLPEGKAQRTPTGTQPSTKRTHGHSGEIPNITGHRRDIETTKCAQSNEVYHQRRHAYNKPEGNLSGTSSKTCASHVLWSHVHTSIYTGTHALLQVLEVRPPQGSLQRTGYMSNMQQMAQDRQLRTNHKNGQQISAQCPNCQASHHAWNLRCQERLELILVHTEALPAWQHYHAPPVPWRQLTQNQTAPTTWAPWHQPPQQSEPQAEPLNPTTSSNWPAPTTRPQC